MSLVTYIEVNDKGEVTYQNNTPFHPVMGLGKTMGELLLTGFLIDQIPEAEYIHDKTPIAMWNGKNVYFKYVDTEMNQEEEIANLKSELKSTQEALDFLIMGGM